MDRSLSQYAITRSYFDWSHDAFNPTEKVDDCIIIQLGI